MDAGGTSENRSLPTTSDPGTGDDYSNGNNLEFKKKRERERTQTRDLVSRNVYLVCYLELNDHTS